MTYSSRIDLPLIDAATLPDCGKVLIGRCYTKCDSDEL